MTTTTKSPSTEKAQAEVTLIPWDPSSAAHVERLVQQRIICGWGQEDVEGWKELQRSGEFNLGWLVIPPTSPHLTAHNQIHALACPLESTPLQDTASLFGGKERTASNKEFMPIGHISLGPVSKGYEEKGFAKNGDGNYWISMFYVSKGLQGLGYGRAAMDYVEAVAVREPLNAKVLAMNAINKVDPDREGKYEALGLELPLFSNQAWYERRGYKIYLEVPKLFKHEDKMGKMWSWDAVFLRKELV